MRARFTLSTESRLGFRFLFKSAEVSNWTYELENEDELVGLAVRYGLLAL